MSEANEFILPMARLAFVVVLTLGLRLLRRLRVSNTVKLFMSIFWTILLLRALMYVLDSDYSRPLDPVLAHIMRNEITMYYQWFLDRYYALVSFGLAVGTSRIIDLLRI